MKISVYDVGFQSKIAKTLKAGHIRIPRECIHNANLLVKLMKEMHRVCPEFGDLSDKTIRLIAKSIAYTLRPDLLGRTHKTRNTPRRFFRNSPGSLYVGFKFPPHHSDMEEYRTGAEFFRCLSVPYAYIPEFRERIEFGDLFRVADAMAHLADTSYFTDYKYDPRYEKLYPRDKRDW